MKHKEPLSAFVVPLIFGLTMVTGIMLYIILPTEARKTAVIATEKTTVEETLTEAETEPETAEIAAQCQLSEDKVLQLLLLQRRTFSLEDQSWEDEADPGIEDLQAPQPLETLVREEMEHTLEQLLSMLTERQQQILRLHFGLDGGKSHSLDQIGTLLGISKERTRQIEKQAMDRLKELGADMGLEDFLE